MEWVVGSRGGSTPVTAILINGEKLIVGNVGDSRAIIFREDSVEEITVDHESLKERSLVESRGGFVSKISGILAIICKPHVHISSCRRKSCTWLITYVAWIKLFRFFFGHVTI